MIVCRICGIVSNVQIHSVTACTYHCGYWPRRLYRIHPDRSRGCPPTHTGYAGRCRPQEHVHSLGAIVGAIETGMAGLVHRDSNADEPLDIHDLSLVVPGGPRPWRECLGNSCPDERRWG